MSQLKAIRAVSFLLAICFLASLIPVAAVAAAPLPEPPPQIRTVQIPGLGNTNDSLPWSVLILFTILTLLPALLLSMTPFVRILIVFHFLCQALGTTTAPTNQTLGGLALFLTYFVMQPVGVSIDKVRQAIERGADPRRQFMPAFLLDLLLAPGISVRSLGVVR